VTSDLSIANACAQAASSGITNPQALSIDITSTVAAELSWDYGSVVGNNVPQPQVGHVHLAPGATSHLYVSNDSATKTSVGLAEGELFYRSAAQVVTLTFSATADGAANHCDFEAFAIPGA
jgi:hypothetical protein